MVNKELADYYMKKYGLEALIATQPVSVTYFSGFKCRFTGWLEEWMSKPGGTTNSITFFSILPYKSEPILIIPADLSSYGFNSFCRDIRLFGHFFDVSKLKNLNINTAKFDNIEKSLTDSYKRNIYSDSIAAVSGVLEELGLNDSKVGIELNGFSNQVFLNVKEKLAKCVFKDCTELIRMIRMIKTKEEISILEKCAEINEEAMYKSARFIKAKNKFGIAFDKFKKITEEKGAESEHYIFSNHGFGVSENENYIFKSGQFILLDTGVCYLNYVSDTANTIVTGTPNNKYLGIFKRISEGMNVGLSFIKPGEKCSRVNDGICAYLEKYNIYTSEVHGHGIGLQPMEYPIIMSSGLNYNYTNGFEKINADFNLEENMVLNLEIPVYLFGEASFIIEESIIVTEKGYKSLILQDRSKPIINY